MADLNDINRNLAMEMISFLNESSDEETRDQQLVHREIANFQLVTGALTKKKPNFNAINKPETNWNAITDADIAEIWCPTSEDALIGVHNYHEDNWRPLMEPYKPSIDVLYTKEKRLHLYHENENYPSLEGLPYFRALQRHTKKMDKTSIDFIYELPKKPSSNTNKPRSASLPARIPPGFERYAPKYFNKMELHASGDNYPKEGPSENAISEYLESKVAEARKALKETYFDKLETNSFENLQSLSKDKGHEVSDIEESEVNELASI